MSQSPSPLDYQRSANITPSEDRRKAARHLVANGIGSLAMFLCCGALPLTHLAAGASLEFGGLAIIALPFMPLLALISFVSGILHIIAGVKIRSPNDRWERIIIITASIHIWSMIPWGMVLFIVLPMGNAVSFFLVLLFVFTLAQGRQKVRQLKS